MMYRSKHYLGLVFIVLLSLKGKAQLDLGGGVSAGFPLLYNKNVGNYNHSLGSPAARIQFNYVPPDATFVPSLSFSYSQWLLPVVRFTTDRVLSMKFNTMNFTASAMIRKKIDDKREIRFGPGIGLAILKGKGVSINGNPELISRVIEDSSAFISRLAPYIMLSGEYIFPMSSQVPLFIGIGGQIQYAYFFEGDTRYRVDIEDNQSQYYRLQPELSGHMINPALYAVIYYRFGSR